MSTRVVTPKVEGFDPEELVGLVASLDEMEQSANGYGELKSAVIVSELRGGTATCTYVDRGWSIMFEGETA